MNELFESFKQKAKTTGGGSDNKPLPSGGQTEGQGHNNLAKVMTSMEELNLRSSTASSDNLAPSSSDDKKQNFHDFKVGVYFDPII